MKKIGLIFKLHDERVTGIVNDIVPWLRAHDMDVYIDEATAVRHLVDAQIVPLDELAEKVDVLGVFGGDGTLLYAARLVGLKGIPIIGINLGSLGFLTKFKIEEMHAAFDDLLASNCQTQERMLLDEVDLVEGHQYFFRFNCFHQAGDALGISFEISRIDQE